MESGAEAGRGNAVLEVPGCKMGANTVNTKPTLQSANFLGSQLGLKRTVVRAYHRRVKNRVLHGVAYVINHAARGSGRRH